MYLKYLKKYFSKVSNIHLYFLDRKKTAVNKNKSTWNFDFVFF